MDKIQVNAVGYMLGLGTAALVIQSLLSLQFNFIGIVTLMLFCIFAIKIINNYKITYFDYILIINFTLVLIISNDDYLRIIFNQMHWILGIIICKLVIKKNIYYNLKIIHNFIIISAVLISGDILLTCAIKNNAITYGEGISLIIFKGPYYKIIGLLSFPLLVFLSIRKHRYYFLVLFMLFAIVIGSRSVVMALLVEVFLLSIFGFMLWWNNKFKNKDFIIYVVILTLTVFIVFLTSNFRKPFKIDSSISERVVIWDKNISLFIKNPVGVGSSKSLSIENTLDVENRYLSNFIDQEEYSKRLRILKNKVTMKIGSEESFFLYFIVNFGICGLLILIYILYKYILVFINILKNMYSSKFIFFYIGTCGLLIHGVFNNFNSYIYILIPVYITVLLYPNQSY